MQTRSHAVEGTNVNAQAKGIKGGSMSWGFNRPAPSKYFPATMIFSSSPP